MKINDVFDYIDYRLLILNNELLDLKHQYKSNTISIKEINSKIKEIKTVEDEGFFMFSPIAAEEDVFNKQEIKDLQVKLVVLSDNNNEIKSKIDVIQKEILILSSFDRNKSKSVDVSSLIKNLEFCLSIIDSDSQRTKLEILKLIEKLKKEK
ncbi:MAG: hypothetical protein K6G88_08415 [Lachnospiraceae bacterium]|nr:hypothetical protein [Lachnospiraceae bacterium]